MITSGADAATPQRSNAPLKDATARLVCRATCVATHAHICSRETRVARAKAKKRARRVLRSHRRPNRSSRRHLLDDEPQLRPANPAERGDHHDDTSLLYSARSLSGLECFDYGIIMFSSLLATHSMVNLFMVSGTPIVTSASLFIWLTYSLATLVCRGVSPFISKNLDV
jgi:hypothetical protein